MANIISKSKSFDYIWVQLPAPPYVPHELHGNSSAIGLPLSYWKNDRLFDALPYLENALNMCDLARKLDGHQKLQPTRSLTFSSF